MADKKITQLTAHTTLIDADVIPVVDSNAGETKKTAWSNIKSVLKTYFDGIYNPIGPAGIEFGGTGADGSLSISSGTTTLDCAGARVFEKNYTSISITGTGALAFSNPHANGTIIILRSQGNVTLTSSAAPMIDASGMGATGGGGSHQSSGGTGNGSSGTGGKGVFIVSNFGTGATTSAVGTGGVISTTLGCDIYSPFRINRYPLLFVGAGGGGGSVSSNSSIGNHFAGDGGRGGGALVIECGGYLNFTTTGGISVAGKNGGNGDAGGSNIASCSGGGGGAAGSCYLLYANLTANSGTITVSGGVGGNSTIWNSSPNTYGGGGGGNIVGTGNDGTAQTTAVKSGGDGANGYQTAIKINI